MVSLAIRTAVRKSPIKLIMPTKNCVPETFHCNPHDCNPHYMRPHGCTTWDHLGDISDFPSYACPWVAGLLMPVICPFCHSLLKCLMPNLVSVAKGIISVEYIYHNYTPLFVFIFTNSYTFNWCSRLYFMYQGRKYFTGRGRKKGSLGSSSGNLKRHS